MQPIQTEGTSFDDTASAVAIGARSLPVVNPVRNGADTIVFSKPYRYPTPYTWTTSSSYMSFSPYGLLASNPEWSEKLKHSTGFFANCRVRAVASGSPFHYGRLVMGYLPGGLGYNIGRNAAEYFTTPIGVMSQPHVLIDPSSDASVELSIPFTYPHPFVNLQNQFGTNSLTNLATVTVSPIVVLGSSNAAAPADVTVTFYVYFTDVELVGSTHDITITASKDLSGEVNKGVISGPLDRISKSMSSMRSVPIVGKLLDGVGRTSGGLSDIAAFFGLSKPPLNLQNPSPVIPISTGSFSNTVGHSTARKLTHDNTQALTVDPLDLGSQPTDIMSYPFYGSQWGYLGTMGWSSGDAAGTVLCSLLVNPGIVGPVATATTYRVVPPVAHLALAHEFWTGSMEYRIVICSSPMVRGRLIVRHIPYAANTQSPGGFGSVTSENCVIELGSVNQFDITVPWTSTAAALPVGLGIMYTDGNATNTYSNVAGTTNSNGFLVFEVLSPLITQYSPVTIRAMVYARAGPDFKVFEPTTAASRVNGTRTILASRDANLEKPAIAPTICTLGKPSFSNFPLETYFGEYVPSIRRLLKRKENLMTMSMSDGTIATYKWFYYRLRINPAHTLDSNGVVPTGVSVSDTMYDWFTRSYVGVRGGVRYTATFVQDNSTDINGQQHFPVCMVDGGTLLSGNSVGTYLATNGTNASNPNLVIATGAGWEISNNNIIDFELPDKAPFLYRCAIAPPNSVTSVAYTPQIAAYQSATIWLKSGVTTASEPPKAQIFFSVADDFTCVHFIGPPLINFGTLI